MKTNKRIARKGKKSNSRGYLAPILKNVQQDSLTITVESIQDLASGILGVNGINQLQPWNVFSDMAGLVQSFKYFEFCGYQIQVTGSPAFLSISSMMNLAVAYYPINYIIESAPATVPSSAFNLLKLPGSVNYQPGATNHGKWTDPKSKQQFSTVDAISGTKSAGVVLAYADDIPVSTNICSVVLRCTLRFYGRVFSSISG